MANTAAATPAAQIPRLEPGMAATCHEDITRFQEDEEILKELLFFSDPKYTEEEQNEFHKIEELRQLIYGDSELDTRTDDDFLVRFLRVRQYNVEAAYNQIKNYESFLDRHENWREIHLDTVGKTIGSGLVNVLLHRDSVGRRVLWFRIANWQTDQVTADQVLQVAALCAELGILEATTQRAGLVIIFDMKDFGLTHLRSVSSAFARRMTFFLAECLPVRIETLHVVNEPATFSILFSLYKRFLSEEVKQMLHLHGQELTTLHDHISPDILPVELGGTQQHDPKRFLALTEAQSIIKEFEGLNYKIVPHSELESSEEEDDEDSNTSSWFG